jgi:hypothetical protein
MNESYLILEKYAELAGLRKIQNPRNAHFKTDSHTIANCLKRLSQEYEIVIKSYSMLIAKCCNGELIIDFEIFNNDNKIVFRIFINKVSYNRTYCVPFSYDVIEFINKYRIDFYDNIEKINQLKNKAIKDAKLKEMAKTNIQVLVKNLMKENDYHYDLEIEEKRILLYIRLKRKQRLCISLPYKTFTQKINKIFPTIKTVEKLLNETEIGIRITGYGNNINWKHEN